MSRKLKALNFELANDFYLFTDIQYLQGGSETQRKRLMAVSASKRHLDDGFGRNRVIFEIEFLYGHFKPVGFVAVVTAVVPCIDVSIPLLMGAWLV